MSLFGMMRTSVSGMQAQATRLSSVAENVANADTTGYKRSHAEFSQLVRPGTQAPTGTDASSGGVLTTRRTDISRAGTLTYTQSETDLAINGSGFFVVQDAGGAPYLTRAGSFVPNEKGELVNAAGLRLTGYDSSNGTPAPTANGYDGLVPISIAQTDLIAAPTTTGTFSANLPSNAAVSTGPLPSANAANSAFTNKTSLTSYDNLGDAKLLDLYFTKTGTNTWEMAVFDQAGASAGPAFPYTGGPLATKTLTFGAADGQPTFATTMNVAIPNGATATLDLSGMSQLAADYLVSEAEVNGNAPEPITGIEIDDSGALLARYGNGTFRELYRIPLANVTSPDNLETRTGGVFLESAGSGSVRIGFPGSGEFGTVVTSALEQSNVDIAEELTTMIQSQRGYTANSKVFQTGSDLMDVLVNLKR